MRRERVVTRALQPARCLTPGLGANGQRSFGLTHGADGSRYEKGFVTMSTITSRSIATSARAIRRIVATAAFVSGASGPCSARTAATFLDIRGEHGDSEHERDQEPDEPEGDQKWSKPRWAFETIATPIATTMIAEGANTR